MIPPSSFARVEQGVYRCAVFTPDHFEFVSRLHLKTILYVSPDYLLRSMVKFTQEHNIKLINLVGHEGLVVEDVDSPLRSESMKQALELVLNAETHPILVMCITGLYHTGAIFGALRQMQGWAFISIIEEFRRFASKDVRVRPGVEHFIERFDVDLVTLPKELPGWYSAHVGLLQVEADKAAKGIMLHWSPGCGPLRTLV